MGSTEMLTNRGMQQQQQQQRRTVWTGKRGRHPPTHESKADPSNATSNLIVLRTGLPPLAIPSKYDLFEIGRDGLGPLHLACREGLLEVCKNLAQTKTKLCFLKDRFGRTPLHIAATKGSVEVMKVLLSVCPDSAKEVTSTDKTFIHAAVMHNKVKAVQYLVKWLGESTNYAYLINAKDCSGNTALHIATSRKQLQGIQAEQSSLLLSETRTIAVSISRHKLI